MEPSSRPWRASPNPDGTLHPLQQAFRDQRAASVRLLHAGHADDPGRIAARDALPVRGRGAGMRSPAISAGCTGLPEHRQRRLARLPAPLKSEGEAP